MLNASALTLCAIPAALSSKNTMRAGFVPLCSSSLVPGGSMINRLVSPCSSILICSAPIITASRGFVPARSNIWESYKLDRRRMYWSGGITGEIKTVPRQRVCAAEVWCEALNGLPKDLTKAISREINAVIERQEDWSRAAATLRFGPHGPQRGFIRKDPHSPDK